jgi:hypothetical protein
MKLFRSAILICLLFAGLHSCKKDANNPVQEPELTGILAGKVMAPNNVTPISHALVFISTASKLYSTYTNTNGDFSLTAAVGLQELHIQTGNGDKFHTKMTVTIVENKTTALPNTVTLQQVARLAFLGGSFDKIETILIDSLGYNATSLNQSSIQNIAGLSPYDAVFINCGAYNAFVSSNTDTALGNFVAAGGSLYLSDYSMNFLTGQNANTACQVPRTYGFIPDSTLCSRRTGTVSVVPLANIVSPELRYYLGKNTMSISYNLGSWEKIQSINNNFWETLVANPVDNSPLLIRTHQYTNGNQRPSYVGLRDTTLVTICHLMPSGNPITITVSNNELPSHLAHGDTMGMCNNPSSAGWIYFTTFHNEHNGQISDDVKKILEYMILNL